MVMLTVNDTLGEQTQGKPGPLLIPLRIGLAEANEMIGNQKIAFIKENGTCHPLLE
jgi:hypothetical protein